MATFASYTPPNTPERFGSTPTSTLRPKFCISRGNGILTPLIALDELPYDVRLQGIPRLMDASMERIRSMECLGEFPSSGELHLLERPLALSETSSLLPLTHRGGTSLARRRRLPTSQLSNFVANARSSPC